MIIIENRTVPCNPRSKNYAKGTVVNVSGAASMSTFVYTPTYDDIINALKNGKDYITIPTILEVYGDLYSLGEVSAFGAGSGGSSGGGLIQTVYGYSSLGSSFNNATLTDTFNAYTINQLHTRLSQVEVGAAINVTVSGTGNAVTGVAKNGNVLEFIKGLTFSLAGHTHDYIPLSQKGTANGVASLDANGLIISAQLPSYVDDVIEVSAYANLPVNGESGKIYVTTDTNITYRWTGTTYVEISKSLALGETSSTAYRGDLGAIAYAHSQIAGGTGVHVSGTERTNWNTAYTNSHTHANKSLLDAFSQSDNDVLNHLSIVDGKLKVDIDLYSLGEVSAFGAGSGTGGSGLIQTVYGLSGLGGSYSDATLTDTFNAYTINSLHNRINSLESGSALNFTTIGSGNAVTSVVKSGNAVTVTKGLTFSIDGHTHPFSSLTNTPTTLAGYGITDALLASSYNATDVLNKIKTVDGAGSGLDADTLDGVHYQNILERTESGTFNSGTSTGWFRIASFLSSNSEGQDCILIINREFNSSNNESYKFSISSVHGGGINVTQLSGYANIKLIDKIRIDYVNIGVAYIELHISVGTDGNHYRWSTIGGATSYTEWIAVSDTPNGTSYEFTTVNGCKSDRGFTGNIAGNASSATRLQIARTIAGVSFDGSDNISIPFANLSSKPTTLSGYGITDAYTKTQIDSFLALKLDVATFNDLFEKVNIGTVSAPIYAIKAKYNFYSVGEVSAFGAGAGSGGSGLIQTVYGYSGLGGTYNNTTLTDTFNAYTINKINSDLGARVTSLEAGSALTFTTTGSGNAVTSVTKSGTSVTVTKGLTFSVDGHTHTFASLTSKPTTLSGYGITDTYTTSSADSTFLKLAGGTMTGSVFLPLNETALRFGNARAWDSAIAHDTASYEVEAFMTKSIESKYRFKVGFDPVTFANGTFANMTNSDLEIGAGYCKINNNTVWHAGNDGAGSGLDADLLRGVAPSNLAVLSATKLANTRTIWGQNFNGEGNVSGDLTGVGSIAASGDIRVSKDAYALYFGIRNQNFIGSNTGSDSYFWNTEGDAMRFGTGNTERMRIFADGNVAIGLTTDSGYKLDVNGTLRATGATTLSSTLGVTGKVTLAGALSVGNTLTMNGESIRSISPNTTDGWARGMFFSTYANPSTTIGGVGARGDGSSFSNVYFGAGTTPWANNSLRITTTMADIDLPLYGASLIAASRFYAGYDSGVANSMSCSGWFRSNGTTGWLNDTYGGGINMTDSTYVRVYNNKAFWVDNNIVATGEITAFGASDIRLKSNIKPINSALDFLGKVKTYEFEWNEKAISLNPLKTKKGAGVIAQEMSLLDNNFVHSIYGDYLGVDYERFIPYLIGGVNEVADEVTILKKRVAELELEVKRLIA